MTDDEEKGMGFNTQAVDQTRDEANMSQAANLSPEVRAPTVGLGMQSPEINFSQQLLQADGEPTNQ